MSLEQIILLIISVLLGVIGFLTRNWMSNMKSEVDSMKKDMGKVKDDMSLMQKETDKVRLNYVDRFNQLERTINNQFSDLKDYLNDRFVSKDMCDAVHKK